MNIISPSDPSLTLVSPSEVVQYLQHMGWRRVPHPGDVIALFGGPVGTEWQRLEVLAPQNTELADYELRLSELINTLSRIYEAPAELVINQIRNRDTLKVEISGALGVSIRADALIRLITGLCDLIGYAGALENEPRPYFFRKPQRHSEFVKNLEIGPMFRGSFGLLMEIPLSEPALIAAPRPPVLRRAAIRLMRGLRNVNELNQNASVATFAEASTTGFNGNMYRILSDLLGTLGVREIEYSMVWSPYWPVPAELQETPAVRVGPGSRDLLAAAATELEAVEPRFMVAAMKQEVEVRQLPEGPTIVIGPVTHLHSERERQHNSQEIVVKDNETMERVHVELSPDDYRTACDAHRDGQLVRVEGSLRRRRGFMVLTNVRSFGRER